jgi:mRNA-degrading endonuclease YafQ of YafQ-DinJ toxin-antitoxin module
MYKLIFTQSYEENARKFLRKHSEVRGQYTKCLTLLELNPYHPSLRLHPFKTARFEGYSVSINLSYRISIEFLVSEMEVILVNVGDHQDIYDRK